MKKFTATLTLAALTACTSSPPIYRNELPPSTATAKEIRQAELGVKKHMKDPESAQFRDVGGYDHDGLIVLCGEVNGKNSFGGYGGFRHFIYAGSVTVINKLEGKGDYWEDSFNKHWNESCQ